MIELLVLFVFGCALIGLAGQTYALRWMIPEMKGERGTTYLLASIGALLGFLFILAKPLGWLPARIYLWIPFLLFLWFALLHEKVRQDLGRYAPHPFVSLLRDKLAELVRWAIFGAALGVVLLVALQVLTPSEIGTARTILVHLMALFKLLKIGTGTTILLIAALLVAQWRFPKWEGRFEDVWHRSKQLQDSLKVAILVMTSLFCFSYTSTFDGGPVSELSQKIDLAEKNFQELIWRADIELSADLRIERYELAYRTLPLPLQAAIRDEVKSGQVAARLPAKYLPEYFVGYSNLLPSEFRSSGDIVLNEYDEMLDGAERAEHSPVPHDLSMPYLLTKQREREATERIPRNSLPDWLFGLPGELGEKIVDRALDVDNFRFVEDIAHEFPLIGSLVSTVDAQFNAQIAEKLNSAAGRVAYRKARQQEDGLQGELATLGAQTPSTQVLREVQGHAAQSRAVTTLVERAGRVAASDLRVALKSEFERASVYERERGERPTAGQDEQAHRESEQVIERMARSYRYDYLLQVREEPASAFRSFASGCCNERELHETESLRPHSSSEAVRLHEVLR